MPARSHWIKDLLSPVVMTFADISEWRLAFGSRHSDWGNPYTPDGKPWSEMPLDDQIIHEFATSLADTIAWCNLKASLDDPANSLRHIKPECAPLQTRGEQISDLFSVRRRRLAKVRLTPTTPARDLAGGRLLYYLPGIQIADPAAGTETNGFFDINNSAPPFDTWVMYIHEIPYSAPHFRESSSSWRDLLWWREDGSLVAWIPPAFIPMVEDGISVNPEECIYWVDSVDTPFSRLLRKHKYIA